MSRHPAPMASRQACRDPADCCRQPAGREIPAGHSACCPRSFTATTNAFSIIFPVLSTVVIYVFILVNVPDYPGERGFLLGFLPIVRGPDTLFLAGYPSLSPTRARIQKSYRNYPTRT